MEHFHLRGSKTSILNSHFKLLVGIFSLLGIFIGIFYILFTNNFFNNNSCAPKKEVEQKQSEEVENIKLSYFDKIMKPVKTLKKERGLASLKITKKAQNAPAKTSTLGNLNDTYENLSKENVAKELTHVLGVQTPGSVKQVVDKILPTSTGSAYAIQVASSPNRQAAQKLLNKLILKGYDAKMVQGEVASLGVVYRIRLHGFSSKDEAQSYASLVENRENIDVLVIAQE
ncbi:SPOR domain-containing protein [Sulfobacillus acidophilus]|uniref:SPOR domain-containing protein n=1 Tax=Sulfobacillus acidophilus TaxID=53633 RepID=A0ABS3AWU8_9FIRM|nr:SPOR domain-containing protein [Sulfobacillus acidophilus]